jgi:hypothetical protein
LIALFILNIKYETELNLNLKVSKYKEIEIRKEKQEIEKENEKKKTLPGPILRFRPTNWSPRRSRRNPAIARLIDMWGPWSAAARIRFFPAFRTAHDLTPSGNRGPAVSSFSHAKVPAHQPVPASAFFGNLL